MQSGVLRDVTGPVLSAGNTFNYLAIGEILRYLTWVQSCTLGWLLSAAAWSAVSDQKADCLTTVNKKLICARENSHCLSGI